MTAISKTSNPPMEPVEPAEYGLNLNSTTADFEVSFAPSASFQEGVVKLTKDWADDMGLHLLQRSMLPKRILKCSITLNRVLKITETYKQAMQRAVHVKLSDLLLDHAGGDGSNYILQMHLANPKKTFTIEEHFEQSQFKLGGLAKREIEARGFQLTEVKNDKALVTRCRYLQVVVKDWQNITDTEDFSPEIFQLIKNAGEDAKATQVNSNSASNSVKIVGDSASVTTTPRTMVAERKRPCSCWNKDGNKTADETGRKHNDVCESQWAKLFSRYAESMQTKKVASGGLRASRWAKGA